MSNIAIDKFIAWVNSNNRVNEYNNMNSAALFFLICPKAQGFKYIKTFEQFCEFTQLLQQRGYKTTNPPCCAWEFDVNVRIALERPGIYGCGIVMTANSSGTLLQFEQWISEHSERNRCDNITINKIVTFLITDKGFRHIKSYEQLCQLAKFVIENPQINFLGGQQLQAHLCQLAEGLRRRGYNIKNPIESATEFALEYEDVCSKKTTPLSANSFLNSLEASQNGMAQDLDSRPSCVKS